MPSAMRSLVVTGPLLASWMRGAVKPSMRLWLRSCVRRECCGSACKSCSTFIVSWSLCARASSVVWPVSWFS